MLSTFSLCQNPVGGCNSEDRSDQIWTPEQKAEFVHNNLNNHISARILEKECAPPFRQPFIIQTGCHPDRVKQVERSSHRFSPCSSGRGKIPNTQDDSVG